MTTLVCAVAALHLLVQPDARLYEAADDAAIAAVTADNCSGCHTQVRILQQANVPRGEWHHAVTVWCRLVEHAQRTQGPIRCGYTVHDKSMEMLDNGLSFPTIELAQAAAHATLTNLVQWTNDYQPAPDAQREIHNYTAAEIVKHAAAYGLPRYHLLAYIVVP